MAVNIDAAVRTVPDCWQSSCSSSTTIGFHQETAAPTVNVSKWTASSLYEVGTSCHVDPDRFEQVSVHGWSRALNFVGCMMATSMWFRGESELDSVDLRKLPQLADRRQCPLPVTHQIIGITLSAEQMETKLNIHTAGEYRISPSVTVCVTALPCKTLI